MYIQKEKSVLESSPVGGGNAPYVLPVANKSIEEEEEAEVDDGYDGAEEENEADRFASLFSLYMRGCSRGGQ